MKILYAEDEPDLQDVVAEYLRFKGFTVTAVKNGAEAVEMAGSDAYDAMIFDVMMPVKDGITAMKEIREKGDTTPAIFLTAKSLVGDRIEGLDAGADDYLTKPFSMEELSARLRAMNRRRREYRERVRSFANLELDTEQSELRAVNTISLAGKEMRLLDCLIRSAGKPVPAEELFREGWPGEEGTPEALRLYISFLQGKLLAVQADAFIEGNTEDGFMIREI